MNQQTLSQMRSMVEFSAAVGELIQERDELLETTTKLVKYITNDKILDIIPAKDYAAIRPAMITIAHARGRSAFGEDWWGALE